MLNPNERFFPNPSARARYVVEKRDEAGALDFSQPQPPSEWIEGASIDELCAYYFWKHPDRQSASQHEVITYLDSFGWKIREKTW